MGGIIVLFRDLSICGILKVLFDLVHYFTLSLKGHFEVYCTQVIL